MAFALILDAHGTTLNLGLAPSSSPRNLGVTAEHLPSIIFLLLMH